MPANRRSFLKTTAFATGIALPTPFVSPDANSERGLTVEILNIEPAFEGTFAAITFGLSNPTNKHISEHIRLDRDDTDVIHEQPYAVAPKSIDTHDVTWRVRHDAGGHAMKLTLNGATDTDERVVNGRSAIVPTFHSVSSHPSKDGYVRVEYSVENDGTAPASTTVEVQRNGVPVKTFDVHLDISDTEFYTSGIRLWEDTALTIETDATMIREIVRVDN
jgi:hypothetical protein